MSHATCLFVGGSLKSDLETFFVERESVLILGEDTDNFCSFVLEWE